MGTRGLICIHCDGAFKLAQYGQWDHYPDGQGGAIVDFLAKVDLDALKFQARKSRMATNNEVQERWVQVGATPGASWVGMDIAKRFREKWPQLSRDSGAETLPYIMAAEEPLLSPDSASFAADSLFCEWAYVIDLDTMNFEVYEGYQQEPHESGRFWDMPYEPEDDTRKKRKYWPVKLVAAWPIRAIPDDWIEVLKDGPMEMLASAYAAGGKVY
tara:strand:+ start:965 stop:1606 length:642 start_codon:yes stop_codon:yes gene_type:complete